MSYIEISAKHVHGRKDYVCEWCGEKIPKGEEHLSRFYIFEGNHNQGRMHLECEGAMDDNPDIAMEGWSPGSMSRPVCSRYGWCEIHGEHGP